MKQNTASHNNEQASKIAQVQATWHSCLTVCFHITMDVQQSNTALPEQHVHTTLS